MGNTTSSRVSRSPPAPAHDEANTLEPECEPPLTQTLSRLESLPVDVAMLLVQFLLGSDVLRLASCNLRLSKALREDCVWRDRLRTHSTARTSSSTKDLYVQARSLFFRGQSPKDQRAVTETVHMPLALFPKHRDISFDVWFALVRPASQGNGNTGGVLVAAQDVKAPLLSTGSCRHRSRTTTPFQWEVFAFVDESCNLYCSVLSQKPVVAERLQFDRWYHVALTYDHKRQRQLVYLDGAVVDSQEGAARWPWLQFAQLGCGFVGGDTPGGGWSGFRGLIDEFRVCYSPWTEDQVRRLAEGRRTNAPMAYALSRDLCRCDYGGQRLKVSCTRPAERFVEIMGCNPSSATTLRGSVCRGVPGCGAQPEKKATLWKLMRQCL